MQNIANRLLGIYGAKRPQDAQHLGYRPDIDGLRALAVLVVVGFHYAPGRLPGGFIGVDVFFVISGYLITGMLVKTFRNKTFSLLDFYQRRIRRIFPALLLVFLLCIVVGWFVLFPAEYARLGKHIAAGAGFVQNFSLWTEAGYFDTEAIQKPLLHLWSLAVEEQFYLFWPLILFLAIRLRLPLLKTITAIAVVSFAINLWHVHHNTTSAFYFPLGRGWELILGAWLAVAERDGLNITRRCPHLKSVTGLILIVLGLVLISSRAKFPGFWALFPVIGAVLLISAGPQALINRRLLSLKPAVGIGLISYPLYLWHWVIWSLIIVIFGRIDVWHMRELKVVCFIASILLAWSTYQWVEKPIRRQSKTSHTIVLAAIVALLGVVGMFIWLTQGAPQRPGHIYNVKAETLVASIKRSPRIKSCSNLEVGDSFPHGWNCTLGDNKSSTWIMAYGDSHAESMIPALNKYGKIHDIKIIYASIAGCLPSFDLVRIGFAKEKNTACYKLGQKAAQLVEQRNAAAVILINHWSSYIKGQVTRPNEIVNVKSKKPVNGQFIYGKTAFINSLKLMLNFYQQLGVPVLLMGNNPQQTRSIVPTYNIRFSPESNLIQKSNIDSVSLSEHMHDQATINHVLTHIAGQYEAVMVMNSDSILCNSKKCPWVKDNKFLYYNDSHLSIAGSMAIYPLLEKKINQMLRGEPTIKK